MKILVTNQRNPKMNGVYTMDDKDGFVIMAQAYQIGKPHLSVDECLACHGKGEMKVPKTYMNSCPCCLRREKIRPCRKCSGKGYA